MIDKVKSLKYRRACPPDWSNSGVSGCWSDDVLPEDPLAPQSLPKRNWLRHSKYGEDFESTQPVCRA